MALGVRIRYSQAPSISTANILANTQVQNILKASLLTLAAAAFLALANDTLAINYNVGGDGRILLSPSTINQNAVGPQNPQDLIFFQTPIPAGATLVAPLVTDATATTHTGVLAFTLEP
jgi:hypothetical protein